MTADLQGEKLLLTPLEAAALLGIGRTKVYALITSGKLASVRIDTSRRIPRAAIEAFVAALTVAAPGIHTLPGDGDTRPSTAYGQP